MISHSLTQLFSPHAISKVNRFEPVVTPNQYGNCLTQITIFSANPNHCSQYSLWSVLYSTANDPQPQLIPRPQMIPKVDRK